MGVGSNTPTYCYIPTSGDIVSCQLTSSYACASGNPAVSNQIALTFFPNLPVGVSITCSANPSCQGTVVTYTATGVNGGSAPVYQWKVNGVNAGINSTTYSYTPLNGDVITCKLTSNIPCPINNPATSNPITMAVLVPVSAGVSITASANPVCSGTPVTFTAAAVNGGSTPVYHWHKNGSDAGGNFPTFTDIPANGDIITCQLTSSITCAITNPVLSNMITMVVSSDFPVSVVISASSNPSCQGQFVTYTAIAINGGSAPLYQWKVNGINVGTNSATYILFSYQRGFSNLYRDIKLFMCFQQSCHFQSGHYDCQSDPAGEHFHYGFLQPGLPGNRGCIYCCRYKWRLCAGISMESQWGQCGNKQSCHSLIFQPMGNLLPARSLQV